jgi:hypothetical protein
MKDKFQILFDHFIQGLSQALLSPGFLLYCFGAITVTLVLYRRGAEFREGLKGRNKSWEAPEVALYLWFIYSPHIVMAAAFMEIQVPESVWWFMGANLAFALLGRYGLEQLISLRFGNASSTKITEKKEVTIEENKSEGSGEKESPINI